jgi:hypothetical protein
MPCLAHSLDRPPGPSWLVARLRFRMPVRKTSEAGFASMRVRGSCAMRQRDLALDQMARRPRSRFASSPRTSGTVPSSRVNLDVNVHRHHGASSARTRSSTEREGHGHVDRDSRGAGLDRHGRLGLSHPGFSRGGHRRQQRLDEANPQLLAELIRASARANASLVASAGERVRPSAYASVKLASPSWVFNVSRSHSCRVCSVSAH